MPEDSKLQVYWTDTITVYGYSNRVDSVRSDELSYNYLGAIKDPVFGSVVSGIYTQFTITSLGHDFGPNPQMDSLILQMAYAGYYGDTSTTILAHAYELEEGLEFDEEYYSNLELQHSISDYLNYSFVAKPNDTTQVIDTIAGDTTQIGPVQRFNLSDNDPALGNKLLLADTGIMSNSETFRDYFNGLYLLTEPSDDDGVLLRFNLLDTKTGMVLYYRNDTADSLRYNYAISSTTPRVAKYIHDYTNAETDFRSQVIDGDTSLGAKKFYSQGFAGIKGVIKFPHLREWSRNGNIAVNEAKLFFTGFEEEPYNGAPAAMLLVKATEDGDYELIEDQYQGETFYDGVYKSSTNEYVFRVTNHLQSLISDSTLIDYGLYIFTNASSINPKRYVFNGYQPENDTVSPFRLELIYTDLTD